MRECVRKSVAFVREDADVDVDADDDESNGNVDSATLLPRDNFVSCPNNRASSITFLAYSFCSSDNFRKEVAHASA